MIDNWILPIPKWGASSKIGQILLLKLDQTPEYDMVNIGTGEDK